VIRCLWLVCVLVQTLPGSLGRTWAHSKVSVAFPGVEQGIPQRRSIPKRSPRPTHSQAMASPLSLGLRGLRASESASRKPASPEANVRRSPVAANGFVPKWRPVGLPRDAEAETYQRSVPASERLLQTVPLLERFCIKRSLLQICSARIAPP